MLKSAAIGARHLRARLHAWAAVASANPALQASFAASTTLACAISSAAAVSPSFPAAACPRGALRCTAPLLGRRRQHPARAERAARKEASAAQAAAAQDVARASLTRRAALVQHQVTAVAATAATAAASGVSGAAPAAAAAVGPVPTPQLPAALVGHVQRDDALAVRVMRLSFPGRGVATAIPQAEIDALCTAGLATGAAAGAGADNAMRARYAAGLTAAPRPTAAARGPVCAPGKSVFVPMTAPGDIALVSLTRSSQSFAEAAPPLAVLATAPAAPAVGADPSAAASVVRRQSAGGILCGSYGRCGGCAYWHLSYPSQLAAKRTQVKDALERVGRFRAAAASPALAGLPAAAAAAAVAAEAAAEAARAAAKTAEDSDIIASAADADVGSGFAPGGVGPFRKPPPPLPQPLPLAALGPAYPGTGPYTHSSSHFPSDAGVGALVLPTVPSPLEAGFRPRARLHALKVAVDHSHARRYAALRRALLAHGRGSQAALEGSQAAPLPALDDVLGDCGVSAGVARSLEADYDTGTSWLLTVGHFGRPMRPLPLAAAASASGGANGGDADSDVAAAAAPVFGPAPAAASADAGLRVLPGGGVLVPPTLAPHGHPLSARAGCAVLSGPLNAALRLLPCSGAPAADHGALTAAIAEALALVEGELGVRATLVSALQQQQQHEKGRAKGKHGKGSSGKGNRGTAAGADTDAEAEAERITDVAELWGGAPGADASSAQSKGRPLTVTLPLGALLRAVVASPALAAAELDLAVAAPRARRAPGDGGDRFGRHGHTGGGSGSGGGKGKQYVSRFGGGRGERARYDPRSHRGPGGPSNPSGADDGPSPRERAGALADDVSAEFALDTASATTVAAAAQLIVTAAADGSDGDPLDLAEAAAVAVARALAAGSTATPAAAAAAAAHALECFTRGDGGRGGPLPHASLLRKPVTVHCGVYVRRAQLSLSELSSASPGAAAVFADGARAQKVGQWHAPLDAFFQTNPSVLPSFVGAVRARVRHAALDLPIHSPAAGGVPEGVESGLLRHPSEALFGPSSLVSDAGARADGARPPQRHLIDLHCGVGLFSLGLSLPQRVLARSFGAAPSNSGDSANEFGACGDWTVDSYVGVELNKLAIEAASANAAALDDYLCDTLAPELDAAAAAAAAAGAEPADALPAPLPERGAFIAGAAHTVMGRLCAPAMRDEAYDPAVVSAPVPELSDAETDTVATAAADGDGAGAGVGADAGVGAARLRWNPRLTTVVVDPPRGGLDADTVAVLRRAGAHQIVYVSCDPTTLARDLALLCDPAGGALQAVAAAAGGAAEPAALPEPAAVYELVYAQPVDLFPQSGSIETVVDLRRVA